MILKATVFRWPAVLCAWRCGVSPRRREPPGPSAFHRFAAAWKLRHGAGVPGAHAPLAGNAGEIRRLGRSHDRAVTGGANARLGARPDEGFRARLDALHSGSARPWEDTRGTAPGRSPVHEREPAKTGVSVAGMETGSPDFARPSQAGNSAPRATARFQRDDARQRASRCRPSPATHAGRPRATGTEFADTALACCVSTSTSAGPGEEWPSSTCLHARAAPRHEPAAERGRAPDACSTSLERQARTGAAGGGRPGMARDLRPPANRLRRPSGTPVRLPLALDMRIMQVRAAPLPAHDATLT